jgi:hypothetical protein
LIGQESPISLLFTCLKASREPAADIKEAWVHYRNKYILRVAVDLAPPQATPQATLGGKGAGSGKPYYPLGRDAAPSSTVAQQLIPAVHHFHSQQGWAINEFSIKYHAFQLSQRAESETEQALSTGLITFVPSVWPSALTLGPSTCTRLLHHRPLPRKPRRPPWSPRWPKGKRHFRHFLSRRAYQNTRLLSAMPRTSVFGVGVYMLHAIRSACG